MISAQGFSQMNAVSDTSQFIVSWPQGAGIAPPGFSWADGRNTSADQAGIDDVGFIDKLIDTLAQDYSIDTNRIYLCGFSNGGFMAQRLACELNNHFAGIGSLGASMDTVLIQNCSPSFNTPIIFFNGTADPAMPYQGGPMQNPQVTPVVPVDTAVQFWVNHNLCESESDWIQVPDSFPDDLSTAEYKSFTNCACNADVQFFKLINGGHTWPGVYIAAQEDILGNTNRDIHASRELWKFFEQFENCNTGLSVLQFLPEEIIIYPNPVKSSFSVKGLNTNFLEILDSNGRSVFKSKVSNLVDISELSSGIYIIKVNSEQGVYRKKLVKE